MVQIEHERKSAGARQAPVGGFQAEHAAERGGHADRSVGVGCQRDRTEAGGDAGRRPARRSAGDPRYIVRIARGAVVRVFGGESVGVFVHRLRAEQNRAVLRHASDQHRILSCGRQITVDDRAGTRAQTCNIEKAFDAVRHARERAGIAAIRDRRVYGVCFG
jgi:hypothetical protein